ncbi:MAG: hypothetical protein AAEJ04_05525 [Planctomycetota bacterium]
MFLTPIFATALSISAIQLADNPQPLVVVETAAAARELDPATRQLKVVLRNHETLVAVLQRLPELTDLHIDHPGHRMPIESIRLLRKFKKLNHLELRGDPFFSDEKFVALGQLEQIKSLRLQLF